jgi:hypothetical protein
MAKEEAEKVTLWRELSQVFDDDFDPAMLTQYLETIQDEPSQQIDVDVEQMLADFKCSHQMLLGNLFALSLCTTHKEQKQQSRFRQIKRSGKAMIIAAAVLSCVTIMAAGANSTLIAEWGDEVLRLWGKEAPHQTYQKSENGNMIYFSDGVVMESPGSITPEEEKLYLAGKMTKEEILARHAEERAKIEEESRKELENTDVVSVRVGPQPFKVDATIQEAVAQYGITEKLFPTWIPDGMEWDYTSVLLREDGSFRAASAFYKDKNSDRNVDFGCDIYHPEGTYLVEKDSRSLEIYTKGGVEYYLVYNLDTVNASAVVGNRMIDIGGRISMEELKKMIDSIYE